jgi:hypothetical protein
VAQQPAVQAVVVHHQAIAQQDATIAVGRAVFDEAFDHIVDFKEMPNAHVHVIYPRAIRAKDLPCIA